VSGRASAAYRLQRSPHRPLGVVFVSHGGAKQRSQAGPRSGGDRSTHGLYVSEHLGEGSSKHIVQVLRAEWRPRPDWSDELDGEHADEPAFPAADGQRGASGPILATGGSP
jgi:hypothetical protein